MTGFVNIRGKAGIEEDPTEIRHRARSGSFVFVPLTVGLAVTSSTRQHSQLFESLHVRAFSKL